MTDTTESLRARIEAIRGRMNRSYQFDRPGEVVVGEGEDLSWALFQLEDILARLEAAERWKVACKNLMVAVGMDPVRVAAAGTPEEARPPEWNE